MEMYRLSAFRVRPPPSLHEIPITFQATVRAVEFPVPRKVNRPIIVGACICLRWGCTSLFMGVIMEGR